MRGDSRDVGGAGTGLAHSGLDFSKWVSEGKGLRLGELILQREVLRLAGTPRTAQRRDEIKRRGRRTLVQHHNYLKSNALPTSIHGV
jgi:hypothetical protein